MRKILVIDNYDSFTYNLVQYIQDIEDCQPDVFRNDQIALDDINPYEILFLSPGPGLPSEAGVLKEIIHRYGPEKKILGVCLGHQAIAEVYGGKLRNLDKVYHGVATDIVQEDVCKELFNNIPVQFKGGRYHSWIVDGEKIPKNLKVLARDKQGQIMALRHRNFDVFGVQFHPESILTPEGKLIITNFLNHCTR